MSTKYSKKFKSSVIAKLLPPHTVRVPDMVKETGIPKDTLYTWKSKYRNIQSEAQSAGRQLKQRREVGCSDRDCQPQRS